MEMYRDCFTRLSVKKVCPFAMTTVCHCGGRFSGRSNLNGRAGRYPEAKPKDLINDNCGR